MNRVAPRYPSGRHAATDRPTLSSGWRDVAHATHAVDGATHGYDVGLHTPGVVGGRR